MANGPQKLRRGVTRHPGRRRVRKPVLDAYRADVSGALARVLGGAAALVLVGSVLTGSALVTARLDGATVLLGRRPHLMGAVETQVLESTPPSALAIGLGIAGLTLVLSGALAAILGLRHVLRQERYLLLRKDGAVFVRGPLRRVVKWRDVEDVVHEDGELVLRCHDGTALTVDERYGGVSVPELAKRVAQLRRRAVFGLLR